MLSIRDDLTSGQLRGLARRERDPRVGRRLLAIANALDGMSRATAAKLAGMDRQTLRDWVIRYNEHGVAGLGDRWGAGRPNAVSEGQLAAVKAAILRAACQSGEARPAFRIVDVAAMIEERTPKPGRQRRTSLHAAVRAPARRPQRRCGQAPGRRSGGG